jgi:glycosyltransferase involved in cell wall biosynthesis
MSERLRPIPLTRRPSVTIVMPCYNYGHFLPDALASVLEQPGVDVDVMLIDDASPDGSAEVVRKLAATDDRIQPILHSTNHGHIATYNEGVLHAKGDYVVMLSADDRLTPGALARATALFEARPSVGMVYGHPISFAEDPPPVRPRVRNWTVWTGGEWIRRRCETGRNCILNPEVVMRTSVQKEIGGYDPEQPHAGDLEMWLRAASVSDIGRVNGPAQAFYRIHPKSMSRTTYAGHITDLEGKLLAFRTVLVGPQARVPDGEALYARARRALATSALELARSAQLHGRADREPVDDYLAFTVRVWPSMRGTREWRALARSGSVDPDRLDARVRRLAERMEWHARWRRWRWTGMV